MVHPGVEVATVPLSDSRFKLIQTYHNLTKLELHNHLIRSIMNQLTSQIIRHPHLQPEALGGCSFWEAVRLIMDGIPVMLLRRRYAWKKYRINVNKHKEFQSIEVLSCWLYQLLGMRYHRWQSRGRLYGMGDSDRSMFSNHFENVAPTQTFFSVATHFKKLFLLDHWRSVGFLI